MRFFITILFVLFSQVISGQTFTSSNLPILKISTNGQTIVDEPKVNVNLKVIYNGPDIRNNINDPANEVDATIGIEFRGQSSQSFPKKGYGFEFRDAFGEDLNTAFLKFPAESDYVLHGPFSDKSLIRNAMAYILAGSIMDYAPRVEMVELTIDGDYQGVYLLTEKIKRDKERVDIAKLEENEVTGDDLTGGYIFKIDKFSDGDKSWESQFDPFDGAGNRPIYIYHYPKASDIVPQQESYIQSIVGNFEHVMNSSSYEDETTGFPSIIDIETFVDFFFINEISRNVDGYRLSTFFSKDKDSKGGKIKAGPVWDFNLGFGNANYCQGWSEEGWAFDFNNVCPDDFFKMPFWWPKLLNSTRFQRSAQDRWEILRQAQLSNDRIFEIYDSLGNLLNESQDRNFQKWQVLGEYVWPNYQVSTTYSQELQWTRDWIENRLNWLDNQIGNFPSSIFIARAIEDIKVYPNPVLNNLSVDLIPSIGGKGSMEIFNILGQKIWSANLLLNTGQHIRQNFNIDLPQGQYYYQITCRQTLLAVGNLTKL